MSTPHDPTPRSNQPPRDELDELLREWHGLHAERAAAARDRLLESLVAHPDGAVAPDARPRRVATPAPDPDRPSPLAIIRRLVMNRYTPAAASLMLLIVLAALLVPWSNPSAAAAQQEIMIPEGGRLDALDEAGALIGPCPLKHTDVVADISGPFARVTLTQQYHNLYDRKIEAVYTFPLSHRGAVDRMTMTVGDRIVVGEVKERTEARRIYEAARESGYVASLLEQERPNIFTQSVANIEPGAAVTVEISYVEIIEPADGVYAFDFPMTVAPRYIPGSPTASPALAPAELTVQQGVILMGQAQLTLGEPNNTNDLGTLQVGKLEHLLSSAQRIAYPGAPWWGEGADAKLPEVWYPFEAAYCNGSKELGWLYVDGTGQINGRWFYTDPDVIKSMGTGFSQDTNQVPDASRITPMPALPGTRAGHDISLTVNIDSGGPVIIDYESELHEIDNVTRVNPRRRSSRVSLALANQQEIPNRDFVLRWKLADESIQESHFTHVGDYDDFAGGFFTLILQPPGRVADADARPRELVFVLDTSGSMRGFPIEKAKAVMAKAIDAMRPRDTFNLITFSGDTHILWETPRPATPANRAAAQAFLESREGGGGTEMMKAIQAALRQEFPADPEAALTPAQLADLPADGRGVEVIVEYTNLEQAPAADDIVAPQRLRVRGDLVLAMRPETMIPTVFQPEGAFVRLTGRWATERGRRVLIVDRAALAAQRDAAPPMRICMFLTDGQVGNDQAIIDAVRSNRATTRVFSFGIGNSPNRFLLEGMAEAGRGEVAFVTLDSDADEAVERFTKRIETPVLTDIELAFSGDLEVTDTIPLPDDIPDLFDVKPLIIHGRYTPGEDARTGTLTIRGLTGSGPYERTIDLALPATAPEHDVIATLWARSRIDELTKTNDRAAITSLGESFQIMTAYTSFVAVEKSRVTIDGNPMLVAVPIEMPEGQSWEGTFGIADPERLVDAAEGAPIDAKGKAVLRRTIEVLKGTTESQPVAAGATPSTEAGAIYVMGGISPAESVERAETFYGLRVQNGLELDIDAALGQAPQDGDGYAAGYAFTPATMLGREVGDKAAAAPGSNFGLIDVRGSYLLRGRDLRAGEDWAKLGIETGKTTEFARIPIPESSSFTVRMKSAPPPSPMPPASAGTTIAGREVRGEAGQAEQMRFPWQSGRAPAAGGALRKTSPAAATPGGGTFAGGGGGGGSGGGVPAFSETRGSADRRTNPATDIPPPLSRERIEAMSKDETREAITRVSKARRYNKDDQALQARLKAEFDLLLNELKQDGGADRARTAHAVPAPERPRDAEPEGTGGIFGSPDVAQPDHSGIYRLVPGDTPPDLDGDGIPDAFWPDELATESERGDLLMALVQEFNHPDAWADYGGELAQISYIGGQLVITPQQDSDEARAVVEEANAFVRTHEMFWRPDGPRPRGAGNKPVGFDESPDDAALLTKLRETRLDIDYQAVPAAEALADIAKRAGITIDVATDALSALGLEPATPITVSRPDVSVARALDLVAAALRDDLDSSAWTVRDGRIVFTSEEAMRLETETAVYDVRALLKEQATMLLDMGQPYVIAPDAEHIANLVVEQIDPDGWQVYGGTTGVYSSVRQFLFVQNTTAAHREIQALLAQVGGALGVPADEWWMREAARRQRAYHDPADLNVLKQARGARLTAPLGQVPLADALQGITSQTDVPIVADWMALAAHDVAPSDPVSQLVRDETVAAALEVIRHQVGDEQDRPVIVARDGALLLTTDEAARRDRMLVVYDIRDLLADRLTGYDAAAFEDVVEQVVSVLQETIDPEGWRDLGGETGSIQAFAGLLIILNTPENHRAVEAVLARLRAARGLAVAPEARARIDAQPRPRAEERIVRSHPVGDLLAYSMAVDADMTPDQALQTLVDFIHENVDPEHWMAMGGDVGHLLVYDDVLVIRDTLANHRAVQSMLGQLRSMVGLPQPANADPLAAGVSDLGPAWLDDVAATIPDARDDPSSLVESLFDIANDPFVPEHGAMLVAALARHGWLTEATILATGLAAAGDEYVIARDMQAALADASLDDASRRERVASLAEAAQARIDETVQAAIRAIERERRLARVLDERLWPLVTTEGAPPKGLAMRGGGILVALLPADVTDATQDALRARGLSIETVTSTDVIVGSIAPAKLVDLALLESVRRVEPVEVE